MPAKSCMRRRSSAVKPSPPPRLSSCKTPISRRTSSSLRSCDSPSLIEAGKSEAAADPEGGLEAVREGLLAIPPFGEVPVQLEAEQVGGEAPAVGRLRPALAGAEVVG